MHDKFFTDDRAGASFDLKRIASGVAVTSEGHIGVQLRVQVRSLRPFGVSPGDPDECVQMTLEEGLRLLTGPTGEPFTIEQAPDNADDAAVGRYLWVIGKTACPHGLERGPFGQARRLGQIKHTNLTGGAEAHCGGELWFLSDDRVLLNGDSGRYGPASEQQLHDAARCLQALGYRAGYLRFNEGNKPRAIATGEEDIVWL